MSLREVLVDEQSESEEESEEEKPDETETKKVFFHIQYLFRSV